MAPLAHRRAPHPGRRRLQRGHGRPAAEYLTERGFRSALPEHDPDAKTWRWPVGPLELSAQLDHLVYSTELEPIDAHVIRAGASDDLPVLATFVRASAPSTLPRPSGASLSISSR